MSTCDHAALTPSFLATSVLRVLTYWRKKMSTTNPMMTTTTTTAINPLPIRFSSTMLVELRSPDAFVGAESYLRRSRRSRDGRMRPPLHGRFSCVQRAIYGRRDLLDRGKVTGAKILHIEFLRRCFALPHIQDL